MDLTKIEDKRYPDFQERFVSYHKMAEVSEQYTEHKWQEWQNAPDIIFYRAVQDSETVGWIVFNRSSSAIEEILTGDDWVEKGMESLMVDALIVQKSLVSAEILKKDTKKYRWMVDYGFRPTRQFQSRGFNVIGMELSTSVYFKKVEGRVPSKIYPGQEVVAVQKIPSTRSFHEVKASLVKALDALGGIEAYVSKGQSVVIKPNVVADHGLRNGVYHGGVVTDIGLLQALIDILLPVAGNITIAEGSSINRAETMQLFKHYGYDKLAELDPERIRLKDLHTDDLVEKRVPEGKRMKSRKIPATFEKADVIINMPVMKTHFAALASLSIKNLQGALPPL